MEKEDENPCKECLIAPCCEQHFDVECEKLSKYLVEKLSKIKGINTNVRKNN